VNPVWESGRIIREASQRSRREPAICERGVHCCCRGLGFCALIDMEYGPNLRLPHSRAFAEGLFELRPRGKSGIGRAFYCFLLGQRAVVLHAFVKKSQQTPDRELKLARKRMKEVLHG